MLVVVVVLVLCALLGNVLSLRLPMGAMRQTYKTSSIYAGRRGSVALSAGLDADTLSALGDVQELNEALDGAIDGAVVNPASDILQRIVASPAIVAVPILAGLLVAVAIAYITGFGAASTKDD